MEPLIINPAFSKQLMSHGNVCAKRLKDHTQEELIELAILAVTSNNPGLLQCFNTLPSYEALKSAKVDTERTVIADAIPKVEPTTVKKAIPKADPKKIVDTSSTSEDDVNTNTA